MNFTGGKAKDALKLVGADPDAKVRSAIERYFRRQQDLKRWRSFYKNPARVVMRTTDKNPVWRRDAAIALAMAGAEQAAENLAQLLLSDKDESVRLAAAWAMVLMANARCAKALKHAAAKDPSARVRQTARKYLIISKVSLDDLVSQLQDDDAAVRQDAAEALSLRATGKVLNHVVRAAVCDSAPGVRAAALRAIARIGTSMGKSVIRSAMSRDPDRQVRRTAMVMYILAGGK
jgi:HEAT repeat protein